MYSSIFSDGMPHGLIQPMYDKGYAIERGMVDPEFSSALLDELDDNNMVRIDRAINDAEPDVYHDSEILHRLDDLPRLAEYHRQLNDAITDITRFPFKHLTYLTVRACPVGEMSSQIHRNDDNAGPWLVSLVAEGSGSFNIYSNDTIGQGEEIPLHDDGNDPKPIASSPMAAGDSWGIYSKEVSMPHAGGPNTSEVPKILILLYGWCTRNVYPPRNQSLGYQAPEESQQTD